MSSRPPWLAGARSASNGNGSGNGNPRPRMNCHENIEATKRKLRKLKQQKPQLGLRLLVDKREKERIMAHYADLVADGLVAFETLPCGDYWHVKARKVVFNQERKALPDAAASVLEPERRMEKQKLNMLELCGLSNPKRAVFVYEKLEFAEDPAQALANFPRPVALSSSSSSASSACSAAPRGIVLREADEGAEDDAATGGETQAARAVTLSVTLDAAVLQELGFMKRRDEKDPYMNLRLGREAFDGMLTNRETRDGMTVIVSEGVEHTVHLMLRRLVFLFENPAFYDEELALQPDYTLDLKEFEQRALTVQSQTAVLKARRHAALDKKEEERLSADQLSAAQKHLVRQLSLEAGATVEPALAVVKHLRLACAAEWAEYLRTRPVADVVHELSELPLAEEQGRRIGPALVLKLVNLHKGSDYRVCGKHNKRDRVLSGAEAAQYESERRKRRAAKKPKTASAQIALSSDDDDEQQQQQEGQQQFQESSAN